MEILLIAAIAVGVFILAQHSGLFGMPQQPPNSQPPGTGTIAQNLTQAAAASSGYMSEIQRNSQAGSAATLQAGLQTASGVGISAIGMAAAGTISSVAGIATLGIGAAVGVAAMLWAAHETRMKNATDENAAWNTIYPDWASSIQQIIEEYNSGSLDAPTCAGELDQLRSLVYQDAQKFRNQPGINWSAGNSGPGGSAVGLTSSQRIWQVSCGPSCTIGCCLFNGVCGPQTNRAIAMVLGNPVEIFPAPGVFQNVMTKSFTVGALAPNPKYAFNGAPAFTLAVTR